MIVSRISWLVSYQYGEVDENAKVPTQVLVSACLDVSMFHAAGAPEKKNKPNIRRGEAEVD